VWQLLREEFLRIWKSEMKMKRRFPLNLSERPVIQDTRDKQRCRHGKVRKGIFTRPRHTQQVEIASIVCFEEREGEVGKIFSTMRTKPRTCSRRKKRETRERRAFDVVVVASDFLCSGFAGTDL